MLKLLGFIACAAVAAFLVKLLISPVGGPAMRRWIDSRHGTGAFDCGMAEQSVFGDLSPTTAMLRADPAIYWTATAINLGTWGIAVLLAWWIVYG